ncbi:MAG TPA: hypothetical protein PK801_09550 [Aggregatilineales bacterium]|jgi:hypothetical protein|nr:hypothetical protein [Chloroflexota bacterium]HOA24912.1 hypothetical protein [Aggregatilineales bacterium]HPV06962.1 hypothetical protein [Aggregatilineales bacterium]HQA68556.1 hypothetical protein [Aggregatilineales bacterium]HQE17896.1 hypothetical protein [Aggregatilineales bacterium]
MQEKSTPTAASTIKTGLAVVIGLFLIAGAPFIVQNSLDPVLAKLMAVVEKQPQFLSGITLFTFFFPLWRALSFIAGVTLLVISPAIYRGQAWTTPAALTAYAMPSIGGMFMFLPFVSWVDGAFPLPLIISGVGLVGFWVTIWLRDLDRLERLVDFLVLTFAGMLATHSFVLGVGASRMLMTRPGKPLYQGIEWWVLTMIGDICWIGAAALIASIPLIAMRKRVGWMMALVASLSILAIDAPTQIIRTATNDYLYGALLAGALLVLLLLPAFRRRLVPGGDQGVQAEPPTLTQIRPQAG